MENNLFDLIMFIIALAFGAWIGFGAGILTEFAIDCTITSYHKLIKFITNTLYKWIKLPKDRLNNNEFKLIITFLIATQLLILLHNIPKWSNILSPEDDFTNETNIILAISFASLILFEVLIHLLIALLLLWWTYTVLSTIPNQNDYEEYDDATYARLQSEKAEYTLIGGGLSLGGLIKSFSTSDIQLEILFFSGYCLLLLGIYYRHLTYAIYMLETKKKLFEIRYTSRCKKIF